MTKHFLISHIASATQKPLTTIFTLGGIMPTREQPLILLLMLSGTFLDFVFLVQVLVNDFAIFQILHPLLAMKILALRTRTMTMMKFQIFSKVGDNTKKSVPQLAKKKPSKFLVPLSSWSFASLLHMMFVLPVIPSPSTKAVENVPQKFAKT